MADGRSGFPTVPQLQLQYCSNFSSSISSSSSNGSRRMAEHVPVSGLKSIVKPACSSPCAASCKGIRKEKTPEKKKKPPKRWQATPESKERWVPTVGHGGVLPRLSLIAHHPFTRPSRRIRWASVTCRSRWGPTILDGVHRHRPGGKRFLSRPFSFTARDHFSEAVLLQPRVLFYT